MTAKAKVLGSYRPVSIDDALNAYFKLPLAANQQVGKGQLTTFSRTTMLLSLCQGNVPNLVAGGNGEYSELSDVSTVDGDAWARTTQKVCHGLQNSTVSNDGLANSDFCGVAWGADENTAGKLSHTGADSTLVNRSMIGLCFGLYSLDGTPVIWTGPVPWLLARAAHACDNKCFASKSLALAASTSIAETVMPRVGGELHGVTKVVRLVADGAIAASDSNYWTFDVYKRTATTPGTAVKIAEVTTKVTGGHALAAFTELLVPLVNAAGSPVNDILESDIITIAATVTGTGNITAVNVAAEVIGSVG